MLLRWQTGKSGGKRKPFLAYTELVPLRDSLEGSISTVTNGTLSASG
jgi:hypothetical protein